jgi:hypothetical protein
VQVVGGQDAGRSGGGDAEERCLLMRDRRGEDRAASLNECGGNSRARQCGGYLGQRRRGATGMNRGYLGVLGCECGVDRRILCVERGGLAG